MLLVNWHFEVVGEIRASEMLKNIERAGRCCYKSEDKISEESAEKFIGSILKRGHESVIEHEKITVKIVCDRGVSHEIVRHRIASYSQESTRYCNYSKNKFGNQLTFIKPSFFEEGSEGYLLWADSCQKIEDNYMKMIDLGVPPEQARSILPNSLKTEIFVTMNLREWRHFFRLRTTAAAHPQIREIALGILEHFRAELPVIFSDIE